MFTMPGEVIARLPQRNLGNVFGIEECSCADRQTDTVRDHWPPGCEPIEHVWDRVLRQEARLDSRPSIGTKNVRHDRYEIDAVEVSLHEPMQRRVIKQAHAEAGQVSQG